MRQDSRQSSTLQPVIGTFAPPTQQTGCPNPSFGFPGGVTQFLSVSVPGIRDTAGLSKYMYRLTKSGEPNTDQFGNPILNMIRVEMPANNFEIEFIELTLHYIPPPRIEFEITAAASDDDRKLLISKQREEGLYPSQYQQRIAGSDADSDHRIDIRATVRDADGVRLPGKKVFLRIGDPPDSAPYAANFKKIGDNTGGAASLRDTELIADGTGEIHTVLTAPLASAGDNYWVQASTIPGFGISLGCDDKNDCFQSGVLTAWKRVYLEADRMFRVGADIAENTGAGSTAFVSPAAPA